MNNNRLLYKKKGITSPLEYMGKGATFEGYQERIDRRKEEEIARRERLAAIELARQSRAEEQTETGIDRTTEITRPKKTINTVGGGILFNPATQGMNTAANGADIDYSKVNEKATTDKGWKGLNGTVIGQRITGSGVNQAQSLAHASEVIAPFENNKKAMDALEKYVEIEDRHTKNKMLNFQAGAFSAPNTQYAEEFINQTGVSMSDFQNIVANYSQLKHQKDREQQQQEYADMSHTKRVAKSLVNAPANILGSYWGLIGNLQDTVDPELGRDYNSQFYEWSNRNTDLRNAENEAINKIENPTLRTVAHFGYNAAVMGVESATAALTGEIGLASFFAGGYNQGLKDAEDRGLSPEESQAYALTIGGLEYITERIPWEGLKKIYSGSGVSKDAVKGSIKPYITALLKQSGAEAAEEVVNGIGETIADGVIAGDKSNLNLSIQRYMQDEGLSEEEATRKAIWDVVKDTADAAITAGLSAGVSAGPALYGQARATTNAGRDIINNPDQISNVNSPYYIANERESYVADEDYQQALNTRQAVFDAAQRAADNQKITGKEARAIVEDAYTARRNMSEADRARAIKVREEAISRAEERAVEKVKNASTPVELETIRESSTSDKVAAAVEEKKAELIEAGKATEADFENAITPAKASAMAEKGEEISADVLTQLPEEVRQAYETSSAVKANQDTSNVTKTDISTVEYKDSEGKSIHSDIKAVSQNAQGEIVYELENGQTVSQADVEHTPRGRQLYESPNGINSLDNPVLAQIAIDIEKNSSHGVAIGTVTNTLKDMYTLGAAGLDFNQAIKSKDYDVKVLGKEALRAAYEEGKKHSEAKSRSTYAKKGKGLIKEANNENKAAYESQFVKQSNGKTIYDEAARKEYEDNLSKSHKDFLELFSKKIGVDIAFIFDNNTQNRGEYRPDEGKIYLNLAYSHNMFNVALHEGIGEFMAASNEKAYNAIVDSVLNAYAATNSTKLANDIRAYQRAYEGDTYGDSARGASYELFNDALSDMFRSDENMQKLYNWMVENEGKQQAEKVKKTLVDYFKDVVDTIKDIRRDGLFSKSENRQLKIAEDQANKYIDQIFKAMDEAIANRDAGNVQQKSSVGRNALDLRIDEWKNVNVADMPDAFKDAKIRVNDNISLEELYQLQEDFIHNFSKQKFQKHDYLISDNHIARIFSVTNKENYKISEIESKEDFIERVVYGEQYKYGSGNGRQDYKIPDRLINVLWNDKKLHSWNAKLLKDFGAKGGISGVFQDVHGEGNNTNKGTNEKSSGANSREILEENVRHSFAGIGAETADKEQLKKAQELQKKGMGDLTILETTGWFLGMDNKWKFEIPDNDIEIFKEGNREYVKNNPDFKRYLELENKILFTDSDYTEEEYNELMRLDEVVTSDEYYKTKRYGKLSDFIQHDELFSSYPWMEKVDVFFVPMDSDKEKGYADPEDLVIALNLKFQTDVSWNKDALKSTLLHEIQHIIQGYEGFAGGSNPEWWANIRDERIERDQLNIKGAKEHLQKFVDKAKSEGKPASTGEFVEQSVKRVSDPNDSYNMEDHWAAVADWKATSSIYHYENMISKLERHIDRLLSESDIELYYNSAGEIEARDTSNRANLTRKQRLEEFPKLNARDVVYPKGTVMDRRYSIKVDSDGRSLSEGQQEYFKDSKVVDEEGRLRVVYHGSMADFNIFDLNEARDTEDIEAFFFSGDYEESSGYGNVREFYLNITNPADYDTAYDIFFKHKGEEHAGRLAREELQSMGYDGVIAVDEDSPEYTEYLVFNSNQIKRVDNKKPTDNPDIRKSIKVDNQGRDIAPRMQQYLKDNADAFFDEKGAVKNYYHGSRHAGFTAFSLDMMDDLSSIFLTDNKGVAKTYSGTNEMYEPDREWSFNELENAISFFTGGDWEIEKTDSGVEITELGFIGKEDTKTNFGSVKEAQEYFVDWIQTQDMISGGDNGAIYNVYVHSTNPLVIDARNQRWDEIEPWEYDRHLVDVNIIRNDDVYEVDYANVEGEYFHETYDSREDFEENFSVLPEDYNIPDEGEYYEDLYLDKNRNIIPSNTRAMSAYAKEHGYDSLVINNVVDSGLFGSTAEQNLTSQVVVVFDPSQVKSVYNENPTSDQDIRKSINVDWDNNITYKLPDRTYEDDIFFLGTDEEIEAAERQDIEAKAYVANIIHSKDFAGLMFTDSIGMQRLLTKSTRAEWDWQLSESRNGEPVGHENYREINDDVTSYDSWPDKTMAALYNEIINELPKTDARIFVIREGLAEKARYSKAVFGEESPYSASIEQKEFVSKVLSTLNNQLKGTTVSVNYINDTVDYILDKYQANLNPDEFRMQLSQFIAYMTANEHIDYDQMMNYLLNIGDEVIQSSNLKDPEEERIYSELKRELSTHKIILSESEKKELIHKYGGNWNAAFGKLNAAGIKLSKNGTHMDGSTYLEIVDRFREIAGIQLDEEITPVDQIATIIDVMDAMKPSAYHWDGATDMDKALDVATTIIDRYYSMATAIKESNIVKGTDKGAAAVERAKKNEIKKLRAKQQEYKAKLNDEFQKLVEDRKKVIEDQQAFYKRQAEIERQFRGEKRDFNKKVNMSAKELEKTAKLQAQLQYQGLKDTEAKRKYKDNIVRTSMRLINWMNKPTDARHVPTFLKPALSEMIKSINFMPASMRRGDDGTISAIKWQNSMRKLQQVLSSIASADPESMNDSEKYDLSLVMEVDEIVNKMQQLLDKYNGTADISRMKPEDLKVLSEIMTSISKGISQMNENFMNRRFKHVSEAAKASIKEMDDLKPISNNMNFVRSTAADFLNLDMAEPITFFEELGSASESIMQEFFDGEKIGIEIIKEADAFFNKISNDLGLTTKDIRAWENDAKEYKYGGVSITLSSADLMSLYCSYNREKLDQEERPFDATHHIAAGGIKGFRHRIGLNEVNRNPQVAHVTEADVLRLLDNLTETQKKYADLVVSYMSNELAAHGNKTSNKLNGYSKFLGKYYFPLKTDNNAIATTESNNTSDQAAFRRLIFPSFTKSQVDKADNALVIMNFFDVVTEHITGMSNYCAYAMPISDAMRWYNYAETERANTEVEDQYQRYTTSVKGAMDRVRGSEARKYFEQFIRDVNLDNKASGSKFSKLISQGLTGFAKAKAVGLNIRVILQQPCAIIRAGDVIEDKYLRKGVLKMIGGTRLGKNPDMPIIPIINKQVEYAQEQSYLCYWKSKGFSDTRISQSMKEIITGQENKMQGIVEKTGYLAGAADDVTWAAMYLAAEYKVEDTTDLQKGTEEYHAAVEEIFSDIINKTQVIDSQLRKSGTMRSNDSVEKLANAFKKEPQKSFNMLHRAYWDKFQNPDDKNANKAWHTAFTIFIKGAFWTAIAQSIPDAWRDDDDEESYFIKILQKMFPYESYATIKGFVEDINEISEDEEKGAKDVVKLIPKLIQGVYGGAGNFLDNANPASSIPYVADVDSMLKGYSVTRLDSTSVLTQLKNTVTTIGSTNATPYSIIYSLAQLVGYATGIGADNALRDLRGIYNQFLSDVTGVRIEKNAATAKKNAKKRETNRVSKVFETNDLSQMKAEISKSYDTAIEAGKSESEAWKAARDMLKDQYQIMVSDNPEELASINNRFFTLLKYTKQSDGKGGYRELSDKEIRNKINSWYAGIE